MNHFSFSFAWRAKDLIFRCLYFSGILHLVFFFHFILKIIFKFNFILFSVLNFLPPSLPPSLTEKESKAKPVMIMYCHAKQIPMLIMSTRKKKRRRRKCVSICTLGPLNAIWTWITCFIMSLLELWLVIILIPKSFRFEDFFNITVFI